MRPETSTVPAGAALLLDLIRSEQMTAGQIEDLLQSHPLFARWYRSVGAKLEIVKGQ